MYEKIQFYINGSFQSGHTFRSVINPADGSELGQVPLADKELLAQALDSASKAFDQWGKCSAIERGRFLQKASELVA
jgi:succinate-semialdehyde dehydrogenase/glutarate-semialdehyde dehydrogenase